MKKVLVVGASGSLGQGVIEDIKNEFDITGTFASRPVSIPGIVTLKLNIAQSDHFTGLDRDFDCVFLIAGAMPAMMEGYHAQEYIDVNITGVLNVLEFCRVNQIKKLIYVMTFSDASGSFYSGIPIQDDGPRTLTFTGDHAIYAITKCAACDLIEHYHQQYGLQTIIFRIPTVYCNDNNFNYYVDGELKTKAYVQMLKSIVSDGKVELWGNPENAKDMPYIKDFSRLIKLAIEHKTAQGIFNAGTGKPVRLNDMAYAMIDAFSSRKDVDVILRPDKPSQPNFTFDMGKTRSVFGFVPEWSVTDIFRDIRSKLGLELFKR
jgi:UDP-glucose 4-epimerase